MCCFLLFATVILMVFIQMSQECAPHGASRPWVNTTHVCNHHTHNVEHFYYDNRTIYNKLVEIEKRIENIEKKENISPPKSDETSEASDCKSCASPPELITDCDNCLSATLSAPFDYYGCSAVTLKCGAGAARLALSEGQDVAVLGEPEFVISCQKGKWVYIVKNVEKKVDKLSCFAK